MIPVFVLTLLGLCLTVFYLMYKQVYSGIVKNSYQLIVHILVLTVTYTIMAALGYAMSVLLVPLMNFSAHWISMAVFFFLGMKIYRGIVKNKSQQWTFDTGHLKVLLLFCLSNSFDAFFAGMGLGFWKEFPAFYLLIYAAAMILFILLARVMARRRTATLSVWLFATLGASLIGMNTIVILILWLLF
jgi:putative Mn2+ efflux pump MntP